MIALSRGDGNLSGDSDGFAWDCIAVRSVRLGADGVIVQGGAINA